MPERIQLRRTKGWRMPPDTVKVDRTTRWGNPYRAAPYQHSSQWHVDGPEMDELPLKLYGSEAEATGAAVKHFKSAVKYRPWQWSLGDLRGKNLACWCRLDRVCHADVLLELANRPEGPAP